MRLNRAIAVLVLLALAAWGAFSLFTTDATGMPESASEPEGSQAMRKAGEEEIGERHPVTIAFAGDVMLSRYIARLVAEQWGGDYSAPYALLDDLIQSADVGFANLETPVSYRGEDVGSIYSFRSDPASLPALRNAGIDVVSIANNHIWDWSEDAFLDTLAHLDAAGIAHAGGGRDYGAAHAPALLHRGGMTIAFLAYTNLVPSFLLADTAAPAVAAPSEAALAADIGEAKRRGADIVVVSFHWGEEYQPKHNEYQERFAKAAIDAGALIVAGHHPHTPQEIEYYGGGLIIYSLGNFIFDQNFDESTRKGLVVRVTIGEEGEIAAVEPTLMRFNENYQPYVPAEASE